MVTSVISPRLSPWPSWVQNWLPSWRTRGPGCPCCMMKTLGVNSNEQLDLQECLNFTGGMVVACHDSFISFQEYIWGGLEASLHTTHFPSSPLTSNTISSQITYTLSPGQPPCRAPPSGGNKHYHFLKHQHTKVYKGRISAVIWTMVERARQAKKITRFSPEGREAQELCGD